jgi:hypothetical protein
MIEFNLFTVLIQTSSHVLFIANQLSTTSSNGWEFTTKITSIVEVKYITGQLYPSLAYDIYIYTIRKEGKNPCMCMEMSIGKFRVDVKSIPTWNIGHV